jgi:phage-related protein
MSLPDELKQEKNKIATASAWLVFLEIFIDVSTTVRIVNNTEDITFQGNIYTKFPFEFGGISQNSTGTILTVDLRVSNIVRELYPYLRNYQGLIGKSIRVYFVNSAYLTVDYSNLTYDFDIVDVDYDEQWIIFKVGIPNPLFKKYPKRIFVSDWCGYEYGSAECGHTGNPCQRNLASCRARNNSHRYGGFIGLSRRGFRII